MRSRLFALLATSGKHVVMGALAQWLSLIADIVFIYTGIGLLGNAIGFVQPHETICSHSNIFASCAQAQHSALARAGQSSGTAWSTFFPDDITAFLIVLALVVIVKYVAMRASARCVTATGASMASLMRRWLVSALQVHADALSRQRFTQMLGDAADEVASAFALCSHAVVMLVVVPTTVLVALLGVNVTAAAVVSLGGLAMGACLCLGLWLMARRALIARSGEERSGAWLIWLLGAAIALFFALIAAAVLSAVASHDIRLPGSIVIIAMACEAMNPALQLLHVMRPFASAWRQLGGMIELIAHRRTRYGNQTLPQYTSQLQLDASQVLAAGLPTLNFHAPSGVITTMVCRNDEQVRALGALLTGALPYQGDLRLQYAVSGVAHELELRSLTQTSLTRAITMVQPESYIFTGTIRDNLRIANPRATEREMLFALQEAYVDEFVMRQAERFDTLIDANGANLSVGERRRLALARAVLHNSPILVVANPTQGVIGLDAERIIAALRDIARHTTVIVLTTQSIDVIDLAHIITVAPPETPQSSEAFQSSQSVQSSQLVQSSAITEIAASPQSPVPPTSSMLPALPAPPAPPVQSKSPASPASLNTAAPSSEPSSALKVSPAWRVLRAIATGTVRTLALLGASGMPLITLGMVFAMLGTPLISPPASSRGAASATGINGMLNWLSAALGARSVGAGSTSSATNALWLGVPSQAWLLFALCCLLSTGLGARLHRSSRVDSVSALVLFGAAAALIGWLCWWMLPVYAVVQLLLIWLIPVRLQSHRNHVEPALHRARRQLLSMVKAQIDGIETIMSFEYGSPMLAAVLQCSQQYWQQRARLSRRMSEFHALGVVALMVSALLGVLIVLAMPAAAPIEMAKHLMALLVMVVAGLAAILARLRTVSAL